MPTKPTEPGPTRPEPSEAEIQKKAYHLWIEGGCLEGVELDNWQAAREFLSHHHGAAGEAPAVHFPPSHRAQRSLETNAST
jgi:hypothetical protein